MEREKNSGKTFCVSFEDIAFFRYYLSVTVHQPNLNYEGVFYTKLDWQMMTWFSRLKNMFTFLFSNTVLNKLLSEIQNTSLLFLFAKKESSAIGKRESALET